MFIFVVAISLIMLLLLSGAKLLVENINSDELNSMGVERKSYE